MLVFVLFLLAMALTLYIVFAVIGTILILLPWLLIGLLAGWIAGAITGRRHGLLEYIGIGLVGSVFGGMLYELITQQAPGGPFSPTRIGAAVIGSILFLVALDLWNRR